jgi:hypothetical protein
MSTTKVGDVWINAAAEEYVLVMGEGHVLIIKARRSGSIEIIHADFGPSSIWSPSSTFDNLIQGWTMVRR